MRIGAEPDGAVTAGDPGWDGALIVCPLPVVANACDTGAATSPAPTASATPARMRVVLWTRFSSSG